MFSSLQTVYEHSQFPKEYFDRLSWQQKLDVILHPVNVVGTVPPVDIELRVKYPLIESKLDAFIVRFQDVKTDEVIVGKILLPFKDERRDFSSRRKRHEILKDTARFNPKFSPEGVCIGLRPVLPAPGGKNDVITFGKVVMANEKLDPRYEYIWFMHMLKEGESLDKKIIRNVALLEPLAESLHMFHERADVLNIQEAWKYGNLATLEEEFYDNLYIFLHSLEQLKERNLSIEERWEQSFSDRLAFLLQDLFRHAVFKSILEQRIANGFIKRGHGDIKLKNIWFSDYYRKEIIRKFKDCIVVIDAIDFDSTYNTIDVLSEAAYLMVDVQKSSCFYDYVSFCYY